MSNPAAGFVYRRKQNSKGEEVGGIVPHITLKSVANNEPPVEEVLVDRPEKVSAPFEEGDHGQVAVKVIARRGNESLVEKKLEETK